MMENNVKRKARARWTGDLKSGNGTITSDSGVLSATQYSFGTRFENGKGTNPEELIAAAHAGCFSMALSMILGNSGHTPDRIDTQATATLEQVDGGFAITKVHLDVKARVPGASAETFDKAARDAKAGCPVSKALNAEITMNAELIDE